MEARYTDIKEATRNAADFVVRERFPTIWKLIGLFIVSTIVTVSVLVLALDPGTIIFLLSLIIGGLGWYVLLQIQRSRDLVLTTEFQNALFASALGINNKFCLIIKRDGNVIYMDRSFQTMFPDFSSERYLTIGGLLTLGHVDAQSKEKIFSAIDQGTFGKVIFDIRAADRHFHRIVMSIEPIVRPAGFILLRGREFIETRSAEKTDPAFKHNPLLNKSGITIFSYIMDKMNMGVYMTDPNGSLIYANPILEQWLSFTDGEITSSNLTLADIIAQEANGSGLKMPVDFEGEIYLQRKLGGKVCAFVNQKIIYGDDNKNIGCVALVHYIVTPKNEETLASW